MKRFLIISQLLYIVNIIKTFVLVKISKGKKQRNKAQIELMEADSCFEITKGFLFQEKNLFYDFETAVCFK